LPARALAAFPLVERRFRLRLVATASEARLTRPEWTNSRRPGRQPDALLLADTKQQACGSEAGPLLRLLRRGVPSGLSRIMCLPVATEQERTLSGLAEL